ncbi:MAG: GNAT family N-acetyltransferase; N-acetyltransferase [Flavobacteriales bacterium]
MSKNVGLTYRMATKDDLLTYFHWANDEEVRKNSFNTLPISLTDHTDWFNQVIHSDKFLMILFFKGDIPLGQVRYKLVGEKAWFNYSIDKMFRGQGYSAEIVAMALQVLFESNEKIEIVYAEVKPENVASAMVFSKSNFQIDQTSSQKIVFTFRGR